MGSENLGRDLELSFKEVSRDWERVAATTASAVSRWEDEIDEVKAEETALRDAGQWTRGPDDFLGVLGLHRDEVRHSRLVAWLLDPCAHDGLGTRFLARFLRSTFGDEIPDDVLGSLGCANPRCEVARDGGRVDVVVEAPGLTLVIENKVDALECEGQCDAYFASFGEELGARFVFLTPDGRAPTTATGRARDEFRTLGYPRLREDLEAALAESPRDARGRAVAEGYVRTLRREFR